MFSATPEWKGPPRRSTKAATFLDSGERKCNESVTRKQLWFSIRKARRVHPQLPGRRLRTGEEDFRKGSATQSSERSSCFGQDVREPKLPATGSFGFDPKNLKSIRTRLNALGIDTTNMTHQQLRNNVRMGIVKDLEDESFG